MQLSTTLNMVRLLIKGGDISPLLLQQILQIAKNAGNKSIGFGSRQDIVLHLPAIHPDATLKALTELKIDFVKNTGNVKRRQNIVSSYAAAEIFPSTNWLCSDDYQQLLKDFTFPHLLRVNISDPRQTLVPLFYGHLNFVASTLDQHWYLYLRLPSGLELKRWPALIHSKDIASVARSIESTWLNKSDIDIDRIFECISEKGDYTFQEIDTPLDEAPNPTVDYEGFGRMHESNNYWAGYYWRNNKYDIVFMEELCKLCLKTGVEKIAITPWKSFIVKDITEENLILWKAMDGCYGITMRHSAFDLNWHLPLEDHRSLRLKKYVVSKFDRSDVCVDGLTFGIEKDYDIPFSTVMIKENPLPPFLHPFEFLRTYNVKVADKFNPNTCKYHTFINNCARHKLPEMLSRITIMYYKQFVPGSSFENVPTSDLYNRLFK